MEFMDSNDSEVNLLNLNNVPNKMISGVDCETLEWVTNESNKRNIVEWSEEFLKYLNDEEIHETEIPDEVAEELDKLEKESIPQSSATQMKNSAKRFSDFLLEKGLSTNLETLPKSVLNTYLRYFYSQLKTKTGMYYAPASLVCIRAGIQRYLQSPPINRIDLNIISDKDFAQANRMLKSMVAKFKRSHYAKVDKFPAIEESDMRKIREYFDRSDPQVLQFEVMFNIIYYFGLRGRETLPFLTKDSFEITSNDEGRRFIKLSHDLLTKNSKSSLLSKEFEDAKRARMFENMSDPKACPVQAWELYMEKIRTTDSLFPKPCKNFRTNDQWYTPSKKVGKNKIDNLMAYLSDTLKLSMRYTNHCIRVTVVSVLKEHGKSNSEVSLVTGHKNPQSIDRYNKKRKGRDLEEMSDILSVEASSSNLAVEKIDKKARIVIETRKEANLENKVNIQFNGSFSNCSFVIN